MRSTAVVVAALVCGLQSPAQDAPPSKALADQVIYEGATLFKKSDLDDMVGLQQEKRPTAEQLQWACQLIVRGYSDNGRPFASCFVVEAGKTGDRRVVFSINEGPVVHIRSIDFTGNEFVSAGVLRQLLSSPERLLGGNAVSKLYRPPLVEKDVDDLRSYLRGFGFLDATVSSEVRWDLDSKTVGLVFHIVERTRHRLKATPDVIGATNAMKEELSRIVQVKPTEFDNQAKIDRDGNSIKDYIGGSGRADVVERVFFTGPGECTIHYEGQEQPRTLWDLLKMLIETQPTTISGRLHGRDRLPESQK